MQVAYRAMKDRVGERNVSQEKGNRAELVSSHSPNLEKGNGDCRTWRPTLGFLERRITGISGA